MIRIQRQRTKGWRMPEGAVYVGRPTRWGNPYRVGGNWPIRNTPIVDQADAVQAFAFHMSLYRGRPDLEAWLTPLRDATALACWCPLDQPCHADVLIELLS